MRVLWFAVTPSMYDKSDTPHNGGGWIASLEALVRKVPDIKLGVAFEHQDTCFKAERESVAYYPMNVWQSKINRLKRKVIYETEEKLIIPACLRVIADFKPDVIHVFGSEWCFGLISKYTNVPVIIHIQGSIPPYYNALYPPGYSLTDFLFYYKFRLKKIYNLLKYDRFFLKRSEREERILRGCRYYMGRTGWDRRLTRLYAPNSRYFYCSEALRESFFTADKIWDPRDRDRIILVSIISNPIYKGADVILKTAKLLKNNSDIDFEWHIFGVKEIRVHEWKTGIKVSNVAVRLGGTISAEQLRQQLLNADVFINLSYIDNSPNSVCEAQLLGLPVISTNVGGISSLVEHEATGLLVPANDPYTTVSYIKLLIENKELATLLGKKAREIALKRHNPQNIMNDLLSIYNKVIADDKIN